MTPLKKFTAHAVILDVDNVDTDQIIPARFLTVTRRDQLGDALFADWRTHPEFALNHQQGEILLAGHNFGCGSSREHAVWALRSFGFRAVVSTAFADIFRTNALGNGLLPIELSHEAHAKLVELVRTTPDTPLVVDLASQTISSGAGYSSTFPIDAFAKQCLLDGTDALGYLLAADQDIARHEAAYAG